MSNRTPDWFNVKDYGAVGDNATDDTAAVQAAINATIAGGRKGGIVWVPKGDYVISSTLTLPDPHGGFQDAISIWGEGPTLTKFKWTGPSAGFVPMFDVLGQAYCSYRGFNLTNSTGAGRAETIGFWFRGDGHTGGTTGGSAIFEQISATGLSRGIIIGDTQDAISEVLFQLCSFSNCDIGVLAVNANTLDLTFILPTLASNGVGFQLNGAGCAQIYGGSASFNNVDFYYRTGGAFLVSGFRSEVAGLFLHLETGAGTVESCTINSPPPTGDGVSVRCDSGSLIVTGSWVEGKIATRNNVAVVLTGNWLGNNADGAMGTKLLVPVSGERLTAATLSAFGNQGVPAWNGIFLFPNRMSVFDASNIEHGMTQDMTTGLVTFP